MPEPTIALGNINAGEVRIEFLQAVVAAVEAHAINYLILKTNGPYLDDARNLVVQEFLKTDCSELLFMDSDVGCTPDQIEAVAKTRLNVGPLDIVAGWYFGASKRGTKPVVYRRPRPTAVKLVEVPKSDLTRAALGDDLLEVDAVGTGFMMIPRALLDLMISTYDYPTTPFAELVIDGVHHGEDLTFCLRAKALGARIFVNPTVRVPHYKVCRLH